MVIYPIYKMTTDRNQQLIHANVTYSRVYSWLNGSGAFPAMNSPYIGAVLLSGDESTDSGEYKHMILKDEIQLAYGVSVSNFIAYEYAVIVLDTDSQIKVFKANRDSATMAYTDLSNMTPLGTLIKLNNVRTRYPIKLAACDPTTFDSSDNTSTMTVLKILGPGSTAYNINLKYDTQTAGAKLTVTGTTGNLTASFDSLIAWPYPMYDPTPTQTSISQLQGDTSNLRTDVDILGTTIDELEARVDEVSISANSKFTVR